MPNDIAPTCTVVSRSDTYHGKQDLDYVRGLSAQTVGSHGLCMHVVTIPPGGRAKPHLHENHESTVYVLSGEAGMWFGDGLREHLWMRPGDFLYIPANMPHLPYNASDTLPCVGLVSRTDPNEQESVALLDLPDPGVCAR
ncbi:MAG TPA: cupin domain-containing protein [Bryobacteraceae bacterium]|jgi:uncharacterized RmlC-like cupin family protein